MLRHSKLINLISSQAKKITHPVRLVSQNALAPIPREQNNDPKPANTKWIIVAIGSLVTGYFLQESRNRQQIIKMKKEADELRLHALNKLIIDIKSADSAEKLEQVLHGKNHNLLIDSFNDLQFVLKVLFRRHWYDCKGKCIDIYFLQFFKDSLSKYINNDRDLLCVLNIESDTRLISAIIQTMTDRLPNLLDTFDKFKNILSVRFYKDDLLDELVQHLPHEHIKKLILAEPEPLDAILSLPVTLNIYNMFENEEWRKLFNSPEKLAKFNENRNKYTCLIFRNLGAEYLSTTIDRALPLQRQRLFSDIQYKCKRDYNIDITIKPSL